MPAYPYDQLMAALHDLGYNSLHSFRDGNDIFTTFTNGLYMLLLHTSFIPGSGKYHVELYRQTSEPAMCGIETKIAGIPTREDHA